MTYYDQPERFIIGTEKGFKQALATARRYYDLQYKIERFTDRFIQGYDVHIEWMGEDYFTAYFSHGHSCSCCPTQHSSQSFNLRDVMFPEEYAAKLQKEKDKEKKAADKKKAAEQRKRDTADLQRAKATIERLTKEGVKSQIAKVEKTIEKLLQKGVK